MDIEKEIEAIETAYASIPKQLDETLHRIRCIRRTGRAGKENLRRIRRLELNLQELKDLFNHQES